MPTCPICGFENTYGSLSCAKCYALLVPLRHDRSGASPATELIKINFLSAHSPTRRTTSLGATDVALFIGTDNKPLIITLTTQTILGRYTPRSMSQPRIDLTPYGAFEKGISRVHAILRRTTGHLIVEDLASSNGTWLNGVRLQPYIPRPLYSGDHLRLGLLDIEIRFSSIPMQPLN